MASAEREKAGMATTNDAQEGLIQGDESARPGGKPQVYYDRIKEKFAAERDLRLKYRPEGTAQYTSDFTGALAKYEVDPYADDGALR
jgi:hypothetical protein